VLSATACSVLVLRGIIKSVPVCGDPKTREAGFPCRSFASAVRIRMLTGAEEPRLVRPRVWPLRSPWHETAALLLLVLLVRLPSMSPSVKDWDEALYILSARALLHGQLPYVTVFDDKPLGAPALIAAAMMVLGYSVLTVRLLGCLSVAATTLLLPQMATLLGLPQTAGLAAAILYASFSMELNGHTTTTELLFAPFTVAALCVAGAGWDAPRWRRQVLTVIGMGLLFGIAIWIKYVAAVPAALAFVTLVGAWLWRGRAGVAGGIGLAALYGTACALPTALSATVYGAAGQLATFLYCNFGYMRTYLAIPMGQKKMSAMLALLTIWPVLLLGALGIWFGWRGREPAVPRTAAAILAVWMAAEVLGVAAPWKFFPHYFLVLLPPLALLSGAALSAIVGRTVLPLLRPAAPCALAGVIALIPLAAASSALLPAVMGPNIAWQVAAVIRGDPGASAWVVNYEPIIYFWAGIPAPTRFPFPFHLVGPQSALTGIDPVAEVNRVLAARPQFLVVDEANWNWVTPQTAAPVRTALARDYVKVASFSDVDVFRLSPAAPPPANTSR
jgi:4-amino-4-deoxy-L-arabinose transferase-like glycosyltransferase